MRTSEKGKNFIKGREGLRLEAYKDNAGVWTIGYGTTSAAGVGTIKEGMKITQELADQWFDKTLMNYEAMVTAALTRTPTQSQFDALVSLCYNVPRAFPDSTVVRQFNLGKINEAAEAFLLWNKVRNPKTGALEFSQGLYNRRKAERDLFLSQGKGEPTDLTPTTKGTGMTFNFTNISGTIAAILYVLNIIFVDLLHCGQVGDAAAVCNVSWLPTNLAGYAAAAFGLLTLVQKVIRPGGPFRGLFGSTVVVVPEGKAGVGTVEPSQVSAP